MKIKSQRDFLSGLMFVVIGIAFAVGATHYPMGTSARPGAGYFPLILSVLLTLLGAVELFKALTIESEGGDPVGHVAWRPLLVIVAAIVLFGATVDRLGIAVAVPLLVVVSSLAGEEFSWLGVLANAAVLTAFSWLVFIVGLKLTIPVWPAGLAAG